MVEQVPEKGSLEVSFGDGAGWVVGWLDSRRGFGGRGLGGASMTVLGRFWKTGLAQVGIVPAERKRDICSGTWPCKVCGGMVFLRVVIYRYLDIQDMLVGWG